jgi:hypothetical protein
MFKYFELATRILASLSVIVLVAILVGAFGFCGLSMMRSSFDGVAAVRVPCIESLHTISKAMLAVDGAENALLAKDLDEKQRRNFYLQFETAKRNLDQGRRTYEGLPRSQEETRLWKDFTIALEKWWQDHEAYVRIARECEKGKNAEGYKAMSLQALTINTARLSEAEALLGEMIKINQRLIAEEGATAGIRTSSYQTYIVGTVVIGTGVSLAIGIILSIHLVRRSRRYCRRLILDVRQPLFELGQIH